VTLEEELARAKDDYLRLQARTEDQFKALDRDIRTNMGMELKSDRDLLRSLIAKSGDEALKSVWTGFDALLSELIGF